MQSTSRNVIRSAAITLGSGLLLLVLIAASAFGQNKANPLTGVNWSQAPGCSVAGMVWDPAELKCIAAPTAEGGDFSLSQSVPPAYCDGDGNGGGHDDTASIQYALDYIYTQAVITGKTNGPRLRGLPTGKVCNITATVNWPDVINSLDVWIQELPAIDFQVGVRFYNAGTGSPFGKFSGGGFLGCGSQCKAPLVETVAATGIEFDRVWFAGSGGICLLAVNSERTIVSDSNWTGCRWGLVQNGASNEVSIRAPHYLYGMGTSPFGGVPAYTYSPNAVGGVMPCPWSQPGTSCTWTSASVGASPTPIKPVNYGGQITIAGGGPVEVFGPGSDKSEWSANIQDNPKIQNFASTLDYFGIYGEFGGPSPTLLNGGAIVYSHLAAAFPASAYSVQVDNMDWQPLQAGVAADLSAGGGLWIGPPDFCGFSRFDHSGAACLPTDTSSLGSGILKGEYEVVGRLTPSGFAYASPTAGTPTLYTGTSGATGRGVSGCDATCASTGVASVGAISIDWPFVSGTISPVVGTLLSPSSPHTNLYNGSMNNVDPIADFTAGGYAYTPNDDQQMISAEIVSGFDVDYYQIQPGKLPGGAEVDLYGIRGFNDGQPGFTLFQPEGRITCPSNCIIGLYQSSDLLETDFSLDNLLTGAVVPETASFGFPSQIVPVNYANGQHSCVVVHGYHEMNTCNNLVQQKVAPDDENGNPANGTEYTGSYSFYGHTYPVPQVVPTVSGTGGSIPAGSYETSEMYVASEPWAYTDGPAGINQTATTVTSGGTGYNGAEQVFVGGVVGSPETLAFSSYAISGSAVFSAVSSATPYGVFTVGEVVGLSGLTDNYPLNGCFIQITALATTVPYGFTGVNFGHCGLHTALTGATGTATLTACPGASGAIVESGGALTGLSHSLSGGFCNVAPGTNVQLVVYDFAAGEGSGATATFVVQGLSSQPNGGLAFKTQGTSSSVVVNSPGPDTNGGAQYWSVCIGPVGNRYLGQQNIPIGTASNAITSITTAFTYQTAMACPVDGTYNIAQRSEFRIYDSTTSTSGGSGFKVGYRKSVSDANMTTFFGCDSLAGCAVNQGTNPLYRCTVAGTLRAGQTTTVAADCGTAVDTGFRVP
jgi:hypothetical protein